MITWKISGQLASSAPKLPYVGTWSHFSKLSDEEKAKQFNAMRAALISNGMMESK